MLQLTGYQSLRVHALLAASALLAPLATWAQAAPPAIPQENLIESVSIRSERSDQVVFDVRYQYRGDHGEAFVSIVMSTTARHRQITRSGPVASKWVKVLPQSSSPPIQAARFPRPKSS